MLSIRAQLLFLIKKIENNIFLKNYLLNYNFIIFKDYNYDNVWDNSYTWFVKIYIFYLSF